MFGFFDWIVNLLESLWTFAMMLIKGLLQLISLIPFSVNILTQSLSMLPGILVGFATATITISTIFVLVGRSGGGQGG